MVSCTTQLAGGSLVGRRYLSKRRWLGIMFRPTSPKSCSPRIVVKVPSSLLGEAVFTQNSKTQRRMTLFWALRWKLILHHLMAQTNNTDCLHATASKVPLLNLWHPKLFRMNIAMRHTFVLAWGSPFLAQYVRMWQNWTEQIAFNLYICWWLNFKRKGGKGTTELIAWFFAADGGVQHEKRRVWTNQTRNLWLENPQFSIQQVLGPVQLSYPGWNRWVFWWVGSSVEQFQKLQ